MRKVFIFLSACLLAVSANSQTQFIKRGKIEFERKTNVHRLYFTGETDAWVDEFKKIVPQFRTDYFDLIFTENRSLYRPGREGEGRSNFFFQNPGSENTVYKDLKQQLVISQKQIFETQFLLTDSSKKLVWKIEPETRTIAGFECRKAVTRICDSVVVVAFYTDEILASTGPESFGGLPGTILGLAIPRLYTTWFATKVELLSDAEEKKIAPPSKGKKSSEEEMLSRIKDGIKDWGDKFYHRAVWFSSL